MQPSETQTMLEAGGEAATEAIVTQGLKRKFGKTQALAGLDLQVPRGEIYALLGPNGAGKSTTLRLLLNLIRPSGGQATVLGVDSRRLRSRHLQRIGYAAEDQHLPTWMTLKQLLAYCRPMYPTWDDELVARLRDQFALPMEKKVRTFSRGMKRKVAMLLALAFRPELLLLDEPFSGLDPIAKEDLVVGLLELVGQDAWTVLVSTHDMQVVEKLADRVGFLDRGRLILDEDLETIHARFREVEVHFAETAELSAVLPAPWLWPRVAGRTIRFMASDFDAEVTEAEVRRIFPDAVAVEALTLSLNDIYIALLRSQQRTEEARS